MCYDVLDVSKYIINYAIDMGNPISNLKLQKLLYYVQAAFLVNDKKAFKEDIVHWRYGPVIEEVYHEFKRFVDSDIDRKIETEEYYEVVDGELIIQEKDYRVEDIICVEEDRKLIEEVVCNQKNNSPMELVRRTHQEGPWENTSFNEIIDRDSIRTYFEKEENRSRIYGEY